MSFEQAFKQTMAHEGGYSDTSGDKGGETYRGISRVFHPSWPGWTVIDLWKAGHIPTDVRDSQLFGPLPEFYRMNFWDKFQGDAVDEMSPMVAYELFDTAVNMGVHKAVSFLQTALNMQNAYGATYADIPVDGVLGRATLNTLRRYLQTEPKTQNERILLNCMNGEQYIAYKKSPQHVRFRGWFNRV